MTQAKWPGGYSVKFYTGRLGGSNPYLLIHNYYYFFLPTWFPFHMPRGKLHPFLISQGYAKTIGFQLFWSVATSSSKTDSFHVFRVVISAKKFCTPFMYLALAAIFFALHRIFWPFHILKWQFFIPLMILRHLGGASLQCREYVTKNFAVSAHE